MIGEMTNNVVRTGNRMLFGPPSTNVYFIVVRVPGLQEPAVLVVLERGKGPSGTSPTLGLPSAAPARGGWSPLDDIATGLGISVRESVSLTERLRTPFGLDAMRPVNLQLVEYPSDFGRVRDVLIKDLDTFDGLYGFSPRGDERSFRVHALPISQLTRLGDPLLLAAVALYRARKDAPAG